MTLMLTKGWNNTEIALRIVKAKMGSREWNQYLKNISIYTRRALECHIEFLLMYGINVWTIISKQLQKKLETREKWFQLRMLQIS